MSAHSSIDQFHSGKAIAENLAEESNKSDKVKAGAISKPEQILQGAMRVFLHHGYAGTSMDRVAAEAGVSKQTIYSHFQDKEGLFTALIERVTTRQLQLEFGSDTFQGEPVQLLRRIAESFLGKMGDREYIDLLRVVIAESARFPELAQLYTRTVIQPVGQRLSRYLKSHPELNLPDPEATAHIFLGSLAAFIISQEILYAKHTMPMEKERLVNSLIKLVCQESVEC